jgi:hypothetical protein
MLNIIQLSNIISIANVLLYVCYVPYLFYIHFKKKEINAWARSQLNIAKRG